MNRRALSDLSFFLGPPHACGYFTDRQARSVYADPRIPIEPTLYSRLVERGFRRNGPHLYRPHCEHCAACRSLRIPVARFRDHRWQRRIRARNADLRLHWVAPDYRNEHYALYRSYQSDRHSGGGMDRDDPQAYRNFLVGDASETRFVEFRDQQRLLAISVVDRIDHGLSAVYTFFDPTEAKRSLGTYAILRLIDQTRADHLLYLYLGYWIQDSPKMAYKARFLPHEIFKDGVWLSKE